MKCKRNTRLCIFCRYWTGNAARHSSMLPNYYEFNESETATCFKRHITTQAKSGCSSFAFYACRYPEE